MANYATLIATINAAIKTNGANAITGQGLQTILDGMVASLGANFQFAGVATPDTNPGTPDQNIFYVFCEGGTYTNFGGEVIPDGAFGIFTYNGSWDCQMLDLGYSIPAPYIVICDGDGYVLLYIDEYGNINMAQDEPEGNVVEIPTGDLIVLDENDYVSFYIDADGGVHGLEGNGYSREQVDEIADRGRIISAAQDISAAPVVSNPAYKFAFGAVIGISTTGQALVLYTSSRNGRDESDRKTDSMICGSWFNLCNPTDVDHAILMERTNPVDGQNVEEIYNVRGLQVQDTLKLLFSYCKDTTYKPQFGHVGVNLLNKTVGNATKCYLKYDNTTVEFTAQNYMDMLYAKGWMSAQYTYNYDTIDTHTPFIMNGKYYMFGIMLDDFGMPFVLLSSTDCVTWTVEKKLNIPEHNAGELTCAVVSDTMYILYRTNTYIIAVKYDLTNDVTLNWQVLPTTVLSYPNTFVYKGRAYYGYVQTPVVLGTSEQYNNRFAERVEFRIIDADTMEEVAHLVNAQGINYCDFKVLGDDRPYQQLFMAASEDRRQLYPIRKFSDVYFLNISGIMLKD